MKIALKSSAVWLPDQFEDAEFISKQNGVPVEVVAKKLGIIKKCRAPHDVHPSTMAVNAARSALEGIDPKSIDLIIWTGSEYKDYNVWSAGIFVQRELGLDNAWAFDMAARCSTNVVGLKVAKALMQSHPSIKRALLCGGHKTGDLVNYADPKARFLNNLSDGGSAMVLEKDGEGPEILESAVITDGAFSLDVIIPGGGTRNRTRDGVKYEDTFLQVPDIEGMRVRLEQKTIPNFLKVIKDAATASMPNRPIDYLALLHMKKSAHDEIVKLLELKDEQSIYLDHYGHFGAPDQVLSLGLAERRGLLNPGDHVVLASAGIGYTWSAISLKWTGPCFNQTTLNQFEK
ncbi:MAG: ketoacyl-ACP synthase III family protein [Bdellovibrio sp.]